MKKNPNPSDDLPVRKRVEFDAPTWRALDLYARDSMRSFQELMDEAVSDLLRKYDRPVTLKDALRRSASDASPGPTKPKDASRKRRARAA